MRKLRLPSPFLFLGVGAVLAPIIACEGDTIPAPGSVMVSITTDFQARKDIDRVGLLITSGGKVVFDETAQIAPTIYFPTTTALIGSKDIAKPVHVRVYALKGSNARVLRQVITTIPKLRSVLLKLPLEWVNEGSAYGTVPDGKLLMDVVDAVEKDFPGPSEPTLKQKCGAGETMISGKCVSAVVDSETLPDYTEEEVFGSGGAQSGGACYDVKTCFGGAQTVAVDANCEAVLPAGAKAYAIRNPEGGDGDCVAGVGCFVPLDPSLIESAGSDRIRLADVLCAKRSGSSSLPPGGDLDAGKGGGASDAAHASSGGDGGTSTDAGQQPLGATDGPAFEVVFSTACEPKPSGFQVCGEATLPGAKPQTGGFLDGGVINVGGDDAAVPFDAKPIGDDSGMSHDAFGPPFDSGGPFDATGGGKFMAPETVPPDATCKALMLTGTDGKLVYVCVDTNPLYSLHYRTTATPLFAMPAPTLLSTTTPTQPMLMASDATSGLVAACDGNNIYVVSTVAGGDAGAFPRNPSLFMSGLEGCTGLGVRGSVVVFSDGGSGLRACDSAAGIPCSNAVTYSAVDAGTGFFQAPFAISPENFVYPVATDGTLYRCNSPSNCLPIATGPASTILPTVVVTPKWAFWYTSNGVDGTIYRVDRNVGGTVAATPFITGIPLPAQQAGLPNAFLAASVTQLFYVAGTSVLAVDADGPPAGPSTAVVVEPASAHISALTTYQNYVYWTETSSNAIRGAQLLVP